MAFVPRAHFDWRLRTRTLALGERTRLMAIVNLTPDSFSGDGLASLDAGKRAAIAAVDAGADIVDLGAESTRPDAQPIAASAEQRRLLPVLEAVLRARPDAIVSVDTYHAQTARAAAHAGAEIINDVSGLTWDAAMAEALESTRCGLVLMHTRGRSQQWKLQARLREDEVMPMVLKSLREQLALALAAGIDASSIVVDPGFGFGKLGSENFVLLACMERLRELNCAVLAGVSRKSFLGETVRALQPPDVPLAEARRIASIAANTAAVLAGAHILRVHEIQPAREAAAIADAVLRSSGEGRVGSVE